jgi:ABC-type transport system substrate-binding protein
MFKHLRLAAVGFGLLAASTAPAFSQGTLRIGMTAADIPQTTGQPDQGFEGFRFAGYTIYDASVNWDLSKSDVLADIKPGLATEWSPVEGGDGKRWTFKLRQGVKFHDGTDFDSGVVALEPRQDPERQVAAVRSPSRPRSRASACRRWSAGRRIDKYTVELTTRVANALFPYDMSYISIRARAAGRSSARTG